MGIFKDHGHPGEVLEGLYLEPLGLSPLALSKELGVPRTRIERLVKGAIGMTPDTALRLGRFFCTSGQMWMNMQNGYDMMLAEKSVDVSHITPLETAEAR